MSKIYALFQEGPNKSVHQKMVNKILVLQKTGQIYSETCIKRTPSGKALVSA